MPCNCCALCSTNARPFVTATLAVEQATLGVELARVTFTGDTAAAMDGTNGVAMGGATVDVASGGGAGSDAPTLDGIDGVVLAGLHVAPTLALALASPLGSTDW